MRSYSVYEMFVRGAFALALGSEVERSKDPAGLADADHCRLSRLSEVKAGAAYAVAIHMNAAGSGESMDEAFEGHAANALSRILGATTVDEVCDAIVAFESDL